MTAIEVARRSRSRIGSNPTGKAAAISKGTGIHRGVTTIMITVGIVIVIEIGVANGGSIATTTIVITTTAIDDSCAP